MKRRFLMLCISALCGAHAVAQYSLPFLDPDKTVEERADHIVSLLTLEEKIGQMMIVRLPLSDWAFLLIIGGMNVCMG